MNDNVEFIKEKNTANMSRHISRIFYSKTL